MVVIDQTWLSGSRIKVNLCIPVQAVLPESRHVPTKSNYAGIEDCTLCALAKELNEHNLPSSPVHH